MSKPSAKNKAKPSARNHDQSLREHVVYLLEGGGAHAKFDDVVPGIPPELRGKKPTGFPHTAWMLLEHLRLAQWDILEFSRNAKHASPAWPEGYWPKTEAPHNEPAWNASIKSFHADLEAMAGLGEESKDRSLRPHSLGRWPDHSARSLAHRRSQRLPSRSDRRPPPLAGSLEIRGRLHSVCLTQTESSFGARQT